jgi:hypothetical protein
MHNGTQSGLSPSARVLLFLLMFAVFAWGFHTKLSHYSPSQLSSNSASITAKFLTDKSVEHAADLLGEDVAVHQVERIEVPVAIQTISIPQLALYQVELSLCNSCSYDSAGPNLMQLPPPAIS